MKIKSLENFQLCSMYMLYEYCECIVPKPEGTICCYALNCMVYGKDIISLFFALKYGFIGVL